MTSKPKPIPDGYHTATPYLIVKGAAQAIEFYKKAFGATELLRMAQPGGKVGHAEIKIGDSILMLADESPEIDARSPQSFGGSPVSILLYVEDVDAVFTQAVAAGAAGRLAADHVSNARRRALLGRHLFSAGGQMGTDRLSRLAARHRRHL